MRLAPLSREHAPLIAAWPRSATETFWLAPRTAPPLTAAKVLSWAGAGNEQLSLFERGQEKPVGYGELNVLPTGPGEFWLGHLIVDPECRGRGLGTRLTELLLRRAFHVRHAQRVTLVVFPENCTAVAAYRAAGMQDAGYESQYFRAYDRRGILLRMVATGAG